MPNQSSRSHGTWRYKWWDGRIETRRFSRKNDRPESAGEISGLHKMWWWLPPIIVLWYIVTVCTYTYLVYILYYIIYIKTYWIHVFTLRLESRNSSNLPTLLRSSTCSLQCEWTAGTLSKVPSGPEPELWGNGQPYDMGDLKTLRKGLPCRWKHVWGS